MTTDNHHMTLVTGGTGKTGARVSERLRALGRDVRVGSRSGAPAFDWNDRSTWEPALRGATSAYLSYFPDIAIPGAAETVGEFAELAVKRDVRRLVLLSGRGETEAQRAEQLVQASGADWTIVRCSWFAQNFSEGYLLEPVLSGEVALPVTDMPEPFVDVDDIADIAVTALSQDGHEGELYELTGPRMLTFAEAVEAIADASRRPVAFVPVTLDEFGAAMTAAGEPDEIVWFLRYLFTEVLDGRNANLTDGVQRALGREPRDFADFAREAAAAGAWSR
jgi:uncharacterized protein YbjT (DUF2867 family)